MPCDTCNTHLCYLFSGAHYDSLAIIEVAEVVQPLHRLQLLITQVLAFETVWRLKLHVLVWKLFLALCCGDAKQTWEWKSWGLSLIAIQTEHDAFTGIAAIFGTASCKFVIRVMLTFHLCAVSGFGLDLWLS